MAAPPDTAAFAGSLGRALGCHSLPAELDVLYGREHRCRFAGLAQQGGGEASWASRAAVPAEADDGAGQACIPIGGRVPSLVGLSGFMAGT
jgi:hypothetical protein